MNSSCRDFASEQRNALYDGHHTDRPRAVDGVVGLAWLVVWQGLFMQGNVKFISKLTVSVFQSPTTVGSCWTVQP